MKKEPCGHPCPKCASHLVCCVKFSRNENGFFYNLYECLDCGYEFEHTPSHQETDDER